MEVTFRMINIPISADPERRRAIFRNADIEFGNVQTFSKTFSVVASGLDIWSRNGFLCNPHEIQVIIDYNTMGPPANIDRKCSTLKRELYIPV